MKIIDKVTGIGSLPHHNVDAALDFSFRFGIPFLPQIPIRNAWEYSIPQALDGLPGIVLGENGQVSVNFDVWEQESSAFDQKLDLAFSNPDEGLQAFEPCVPASSCWQPFLWELLERGCPVAKIQIAGPMTAQWALTAPVKSPELSPHFLGQIFRLVLARALAMVRSLTEAKIQPILFIDEPGLYLLSAENPKHQLCLRELKLTIQTLQKHGATVGIHCCSDTDWKAVLDLGINILSIDTSLSLQNCLAPANLAAFEDWINGPNQGRFSFGVVPTQIGAQLNPSDLAQNLESTLRNAWPNDPARVNQILAHALFTPACGLALHTPTDAEIILETLFDVYEKLSGTHSAKS